MDTLTKELGIRDEWIGKADVRWFDDGGKIMSPKGYSDNLRYRIWLGDVVVRGVDDDFGIRKELVKRAREDVLFFFNTFLWTVDPRKGPSDLPFVTYDYEDAYIRWLVEHIDGRKDCLTEKSRDMGATWCVLGVMVWCWLFREKFLALVGSKKEDDVDRSGDLRSLFEKMRYMVRQMPGWLMPYRFEWGKSSMFMRLLNPANGSSITGESSNRDFGRSGRYSLCYLDEFAAMEYATDAWTATNDSAPCRVVTSTPKGTGNKFWELRFKSNIDRFTMHWTMHPEKSMGVYRKADGAVIGNTQDAFTAWRNGEKVGSPWYDGEVNRRLTTEAQSRVDIAQELDIDYVVSGNPYFDIEALGKQAEWEVTEDWVNFDKAARKLIVGKIVEVDNKVEFRPDKNGWLRLYELPKVDGQFICGIDPAEGLSSGNYSCAAVRNKYTRNLCAAVYGKFDYDDLSWYSFLVSRYFNNCLCGAESGGYGAAVNKRLFDLGANVVRAVDTSTGAVEEKDKLGFMNTSRSRPQALGDMEAEIREKSCELRDKDLITECRHFVNLDGKPQAAEGATDDFIWAFAISGQLLRYFPYSSSVAKGFSSLNRMLSFKPPANMGFGFKKKK